MPVCFSACDSNDSNCFCFLSAYSVLATKISFIKEIANFCDKIGADVHHVASGMGLDNRIGKKFLHTGPGFDVLCFPKDRYSLLHAGEQHDVNFQILRSVVNVNEQQRDLMIQKVKQAVKGKKLLPELIYCEDTYEVATYRDALIFITEWNQFRSLDLATYEDGNYC